MYTLASKPPEWFTLGLNVRQKDSPAYARDELLRLGESMRGRQLEPVGASADGQLRWGFRRVMAALLVKLPSVLAVICDDDLDETGWKLAALQENMLRAEMTDVEIYLQCRSLFELNPGWRNVDLVNRLHLAPYEVTRIMAADDVIPAVRDAFLEGKLSRNEVYAAKKKAKVEQPAWLASKLRGAGHQPTNGQATPENGGQSGKAPKIAVPLEGGGLLTIGGHELSSDSLDGVIGVLEKVLKSARDGQKAKYQVSTWLSILRDQRR